MGVYSAKAVLEGKGRDVWEMIVENVPWPHRTNACQSCAIKQRCTTGKERRITRSKHEDVLEAVQKRLDKNPQAMRQRRETVEHPFATLKMRMGATHLVMKRLPKVATETALHVLAYNLTRIMNIMRIQPLMAAGATTSPASDLFRKSVLTRPDPLRTWHSAIWPPYRCDKLPATNRQAGRDWRWPARHADSRGPSSLDGGEAQRVGPSSRETRD
jgi:hypothetical protein